MDDRIPEEGVDDDALGDGDAGDTAGWSTRRTATWTTPQTTPSPRRSSPTTW